MFYGNLLSCNLFVMCLSFSQLTVVVGNSGGPGECENVIMSDSEDGSESSMIFSDPSHLRCSRAVWAAGGLVMNFEFESLRTRERDHQAYKEAFDYYDWNKSGTISVKVEKEAARAI